MAYNVRLSMLWHKAEQFEYQVNNECCDGHRNIERSEEKASRPWNSVPCHDTPALFTRIVNGPDSFSIRATTASIAAVSPHLPSPRRPARH